VLVDRWQSPKPSPAQIETIGAPIIYRALFGPPTMPAERAQALVAACMKTARKVRAPA